MNNLDFFETEINATSLRNMMYGLKSINSYHCLYIDSNGGELNDLMRLLPDITTRKLSTFAGNIASAAIPLFLSGAKRYAFPDSTFAFHSVKIEEARVPDEVKVYAVLNSVEFAIALSQQILEEESRRRNVQSKLLDYLASRTCGLGSKYYFTNLMQNSVTIDAYEALRRGLVHTIIPSL